MSTLTIEAGADIDSLLDSTLDDLADVPEFKPYPVGAHRVNIFWEVKVINAIPSISLKIVGIETVELKDPETDKPIEKGHETNQLFMLKTKDGKKNELGEGQWKELLAPLQAHFGTASNRETMEASQGAECVAITEIRKDKNFKENGKIYTSIKSLAVM